MAKQVTIYTDGSSRGNPGPGGYGAVLHYWDAQGTLHSKELSAGYELTTNNRMELLGAIVALEALKTPCDVIVVSDSQYLVKTFTEHRLERWVRAGWKGSNKKPVKNIDLWQRLMKAMEGHHVTFEWIQGHAGHEFNERCDQLATAAADAPNRLIDKEFAEGCSNTLW